MKFSQVMRRGMISNNEIIQGALENERVQEFWIQEKHVTGSFSEWCQI
jgi:hypothetical protein